jgi:hypothetical protein
LPDDYAGYNVAEPGVDDSMEATIAVAQLFSTVAAGIPDLNREPVATIALISTPTRRNPAYST